MEGTIEDQYEWCPYKKRLEQRLEQRKDQVKTEGEDSHPQVKEGGLKEISPVHRVILNF